MASVNKVMIVGYLGREPELRYLPDGNPVVTLSVATSERWKDRATGQAKESTEWHRVVMFRGLADIAEKYLQKGSLVFIEGRLRTKSWKDKNGVERFTTEIVAEEMKMLGGGRGKGDEKQQTLNNAAQFDPDDIPF